MRTLQMLKKASLVLALMMMTGCTREVYLQPVPCADCEPKPCERCTDLTPECCPELAMHREIQVYEVYEEIPCQPTCVNNPCANTVTTTTVTEPRRNCRTVCRQRMINE